MQAAALCFAPPLPLTPTKRSSLLTRSSAPKLARSLASRCSPIVANAVVYDSSTVDYSSMMTSVFPAEACETIGGEACVAEAYPEVKLKPETKNSTRIALELIDREYLEYSDPKTAFRGEACDDLGGEFCERAFQKGVY